MLWIVTKWCYLYLSGLFHCHRCNNKTVPALVHQIWEYGQMEIKDTIKINYKTVPMRHKKHVSLYGIYCTNNIYNVVSIYIWYYFKNIHINTHQLSMQFIKYAKTLIIKGTGAFNKIRGFGTISIPALKYSIQHDVQTVILAFNVSIRLNFYIFMAGKSPNDV